MRRLTVCGGSAKVEERFYAHLSRRELLVHEIQIDNSGSGSGTSSSPCTIELNHSNSSASADFVSGALNVSYTHLSEAHGNGSDGASVRMMVGEVAHSERPSIPRPIVALASTLPAQQS